MRDARRHPAMRIAAPVAVLLAVTVAVLLVRSALQADTEPRPTAPEVAEGPRTVVVGEGDTIASIAAAAGVPVAQVRRLNPGLQQDDLIPGRSVRVR